MHVSDRRAYCASPRTDGQPCRAYAQPGKTVCLWHDPSDDARAKHREQCRKGGQTKAYGALTVVEPLANDPAVAELDLQTVEGLRGLLAVTLRALTTLPFDTRIAMNIGQISTAQRTVIVESDLERRLAELEAAASPA
jgi:hypothetical protein